MDEQENFELNLLFDGSKQPVSVFNEIGSFIEILNDFDKWIIKHIDANSSVSYSLLDIEYGSIKTRIAQILRSIPDDAIKNLDWKTLVGNLLLKVKYLFLKMLEENKKIDSKIILETLTQEINSEVKKVESISGQFIIPEINIYILLNNIDSAIKKVNSLPQNESFEYRSKFGSATLTNGLFLNKSKIITELGATTVTNDTTEILKIKKVDMLSNDAKWEFKLGNRNISAKIVDKNWLDKYHKREIILKPEDALKVILKTSYTYSSNNEHTLFNYEIIDVISIITPESTSTNLNLF